MILPEEGLGRGRCLPPEEPVAYEPPKDDPELRALIDVQYRDDITGNDSQLNCPDKAS